MKNVGPSRSGTGRIWRALVYSVAGLRAAFAEEAAFRQELALACILIPVALLIPATGSQRALLVMSVMAVLIVELLNSAIEATVDRISTEEHELARRAKDLGSAAVFVSLIACALVWLLVLADVWR